MNMLILSMRSSSTIIGSFVREKTSRVELSRVLFKGLISQNFFFYFRVEDKKLVNTFFNTFWFSLFIREIYGLKRPFS